MMWKLIDKCIFLINLIFIIGLLAAYFAKYIDPNTFSWFSLFGLGYPYLLLGNVLFLIYWIYRLKKRAFISLIVILAGIPVFKSYYGTYHEKNPVESGKDITLMTFNVRYFDKYNWSGDSLIFSKLCQYLNDFNGDFICLQEFPGSTASIKRVVQGLMGYPYHFIQGGVAVFSRIPVFSEENLHFDNINNCGICFDVSKGNDTLRVYNIHLESYKLDNDDRKFVKEITRGNIENISDNVKSIGGRMQEANKIRAKQAAKLAEHMQMSPYDVILCGDFNDTPLSYTYYILNKGMTDSFLEKGRGLGNTYIGEFPSFRIDYILHSKGLETVSYRRENVILSDHYPVIVELKRRTAVY